MICGKLIECKIMQHIGRNTLCILGLHMITFKFANEIALFFAQNIGFENVFLITTLTTLIALLLCSGLLEVYRVSLAPVFRRFSGGVIILLNNLIFFQRNTY